LFVQNGDEAIEFYERAFGAQVLYRSSMPGGNGIFAQLRVGESVVQVASESEQKPCEGGPVSPQTLGGTSVILWALATVKETVTPDEIQRRIDEMMAVEAHS